MQRQFPISLEDGLDHISWYSASLQTLRSVRKESSTPSKQVNYQPQKLEQAHLFIWKGRDPKNECIT